MHDPFPFAPGRRERTLHAAGLCLDDFGRVLCLLQSCLGRLGLDLKGLEDGPEVSLHRHDSRRKCKGVRLRVAACGVALHARPLE